LYASKALEIVQTLEPRRQEQCAAMVANIYRDMGRIDLAKEQYLNALNLNRLTQNLDNRAWYYLCLGEMFKYEMLTVEALSYYKKAYDLYKLPGSQDQALFLNLLISMFDTYAITYSSESSEGHVKNNERNFHDIGKEIFQELNSANMLHSTEAANAWLIIGKYYAGKSNYDSALNSYQQALIASVPAFTSENVLDNPTEDMVGFQYYVNEILTRKASALKKAFEETANIDYLNKSFDCLELAEQLLSKQRNTLDMEHSKWLFLEENFDLYETILEQLYEAKEYLSKDTVHARAFEYFERSKARSLADALALTERTNQFNSQDTLFQMQADLKRRLLSAQANVTRGLEKSVDASELLNYRNEIIELDQQIQAVKHQIEEKYPGYFNVKYGRRATPFSKVKTLLKENDRVLLEYFWGSNGVYALSVSEHETVFRRVGSPDSIKNLINTLLLQLTPAGSTTDVNRFNQFTSSAFDLYTKLVTPFAEIIKGSQRIQIIPDGPISQVPFEILLSEASNKSHVDYRSLNYMVKSFAIGYAYSSAMLNSGLSSQKLSSPSLLAMGFTDGQALPGTDGHLSRIIGAEDELHALAERFSSGKFLFGKDANETNFKSLAPDYDIIHLAVHGSGDVEKNFAASLYFGERNKAEDGELHAYELYGLKLDALMAVLSSCESGLGMGYRGEGMISMASAFTYSGCQNILMSLWKVNDQAAMKLMDDFYGYLLEGETIDAALRQAKLKYLETSDELTADPRIWTPLVAYGNLNPIFDRGIGNVFIYGGLIVISAIVLLSWKIITSKRRRS
jgi:CHAT domain-containing protein